MENAFVIFDSLKKLLSRFDVNEKVAGLGLKEVHDGGVEGKAD